MSNTEINALIHLLDDDDADVLSHVYTKLISYGPEILPSLEEAWHDDLTPATHERLEEIIHEIQYETVLRDLELWLQKGDYDLLTGSFLITRYYYPQLKIDEVKKKMQKLRQTIWLELNHHQTPLEQVQIFNQVFYGLHKFTGNQQAESYNDFCINSTLESKSGNAIMVGIVYQIIANELDLPVYGVALPRHFVLSFCKKQLDSVNFDDYNEREVMFYINPINNGAIFSRNEIKDYLTKMEIISKQQYFTPANNVGIITELVTYLIQLEEAKNNSQAVNELKNITDKLLHR